MTLTIHSCENGWLIEHEYPWEENERTDLYVFQGYEELEDVEACADMLRMVNELVGPTTSRYSEKRVHVSTEPGDKFGDSKE